MTPAEIIAAAMGAISAAKALIELGQQIHGNRAVPTWDEMLAQWQVTQDKIDAEIAKP